MQPNTMAPLPPSPVSASPSRNELEILQGAWSFASGRRHVELLIAGNNFAVKFKNGPLYMGTFRIDAEQKPKTMDMLVQEGPERHRWKTALCIYDVDGDTLRWCASEPGRRERLEDFPPEDHLAYYCTQFRRERG
jgi:uncharacterized protein (TIGR03067 family)